MATQLSTSMILNSQPDISIDSLAGCFEMAECETLSTINSPWFGGIGHHQGTLTPCKHSQHTHPCVRCGNS